MKMTAPMIIVAWLLGISVGAMLAFNDKAEIIALRCDPPLDETIAHLMED